MVLSQTPSLSSVSSSHSRRATPPVRSQTMPAPPPPPNLGPIGSSSSSISTGSTSTSTGVGSSGGSSGAGAFGPVGSGYHHTRDEMGRQAMAWTPNRGGTGYDFPQPRPPGLYSQPNHSSPSLAQASLRQSYLTEDDLNDNNDLHDINAGLDSMSLGGGGGGGGGGGAGGGNEVDGYREEYDGSGGGGQRRASVGSSILAYHQPGPTNGGGSGYPHSYGNDTNQYYNNNGFDPSSSSSSFTAPYNPSSSSSHSHLPQIPYSTPSPHHHLTSMSPLPPPQQHLQQQQSYGVPLPPTSYGQPNFQPQPQHGGYDYSAAAAQNPYYAAATGQLGFPDQGVGVGGTYPGSPQSQYANNRGFSELSSVSSIGSGGGFPAGGGGGGGLIRSGSMANISNGGGGGGGGGTVRRPGGGSRTSTTSTTASAGGPPITKASVDEYRNRIKADPDPEAQFNFAKYLIEAAKKISSSASGDEKAAKKYRDALLAESVKLIKRLATQGVGLGKPAYADAQFFLANCLGNGSLGLQVDHEKAYNLYVQASKQNHSSATYRTAVCNEVGAGTRRDHARAVLFYRKASALGDTAGMYKLGMILLNGLLGQQKNIKDAIMWLRRAADQADEDNPHALHEVGLLYEKAPPAGTPSPLAQWITFDPAYARELFTTAGQYGYPPSQFKLGSCYEYGTLTCPVDPRRSIAWYTRAAERGDAESELALSGWYLTGSEGILKQSDSEAYLWARRAANKGLPKAEYAVGYYSEVGIGVKQDAEEAKRWYMRAAAQGNRRAMTRLQELRELTKQESAKGGKVTKSDARKR